jgi:hypothetical protein
VIQGLKNNPRNGDSGSLRPKKFTTQKSSSEVLASAFWDKDGVLLVDCLEQGEAITAEYYTAPFEKLKQQLVSIRRDKLSKGILFLQDNAAPHKEAITHHKLANLHFDVLKHPNLASWNYHRFLNMKKHLEHWRGYIGCGRAVCNTRKTEFFLDGLRRIRITKS